MGRITASGDTLMRQAPATIEIYLREAVEMIDKRFGDGFAHAQPALVASLVQSMARDLHTSLTAQAIGDAADAFESLGTAIGNIEFPG